MPLLSGGFFAHLRGLLGGDLACFDGGLPRLIRVLRCFSINQGFPPARPIRRSNGNVAPGVRGFERVHHFCQVWFLFFRFNFPRSPAPRKVERTRLTRYKRSVSRVGSGRPSSAMTFFMINVPKSARNQFQDAWRCRGHGRIRRHTATARVEAGGPGAGTPRRASLNKGWGL